MIQCEIWPCLVEHKADILAGTEKRPDEDLIHLL